MKNEDAHPHVISSELEQLLAEGEADILRGHVYDGEVVFEEIAKLSEERRRIARE